MNINSVNKNTSRRRIKKSFVKTQESRETSSFGALVNCDSTANQSNRYSSDASFSGQRRSKLSINDESSHPINDSNTNNKRERKRNIKMLCDEDKKVLGDVIAAEGDARDNMKRIKVDANGDGHDNNKTKMFQVSSQVSKDFQSFSLFLRIRATLIVINFSKAFAPRPNRP